MTIGHNFIQVLCCNHDSTQLEVYESGDGRIRVVLTNLDKSVTLASKVFRDSETQHSDSERWLNDQVGWPNPYAGLLISRAWNK
jgi:hypothetical protein